tara:strand:+ start:525 stop:971 length:447 start_codon:yes stop_codon:yes gene_type:complete
MTICPKCGKSFSSEQALCYHLNKKYPCGTWKCNTCNSTFDTKFALKIHSMSCCNNYTTVGIPSYDTLCKMYKSTSITFYEVDDNGIIHSASPGCIKNFGFHSAELVGKRLDNFTENIDGEYYHKTKSGDNIHVKLDSNDSKLVCSYII